MDSEGKSDFFDDAKAHTRAKHQILKEYLKGWIPVLGQGQRNRLLYFDGFAGCGELKGNHPGSPIVALRTAVQAYDKLAVPLEVRMVEKAADKCQHLQRMIAKERESVPARIKIIDPVCDECENEVVRLLNEHDAGAKRIGPAFFFLDQYGYAGFSMDLVGRIMAYDKTEVFAYLNWQRMNPYFTDQTKWPTLTRALGGERWRELQHLEGPKRATAFKEIYIDALRSKGRSKFVYDFAMRGPENQLIYWLFFCTNNLKGLEVMKKAMWVVDPTGRFEFSDRDVGQEMLLPNYTQTDLAEDLKSKLMGQRLSEEELEKHVLTSTPEYRHGDAIKMLKREGVVTESKTNAQRFYRFSEAPKQLF